MFEALFAIFSLVAILYLIIEVLSTVSLTVYGMVTIVKNIIMYLTNPNFRKVCKSSNDSKFIFKAHSEKF